MTTMRAVRIHAYGGADVLRYEDAPRPEVSAGEVLVRVYAASVNPFDWKVRAGYLAGFLPYQLPFILGWDVSGVIEAVGPEVSDLAVGDAVFGQANIIRGGAYAEYAIMRASEVVRKPETLDHIQAAATPQAALSAWRCLIDGAELSEGQSVLIHGAAGGVGTFAVQVAKLRGARVIGTASANNRDMLLSLGADEVIDYNRHDSRTQCTMWTSSSTPLAARRCSAHGACSSLEGYCSHWLSNHLKKRRWPTA